MDSETTTRLLFAGFFVLAGFAMGAYSLWARLGRSERSRRWMTDINVDGTEEERMMMLGVPALAGLSFLFGLGLLPVVGPYVLVATAPVMLVLFLAFAVAKILLFIRIPDALYPRWARPIRAERPNSKK